jgi:CBS-domain-containing membrane protein
MGPQTKVAEVMTRDVKYCFEDEDITGVAANMADIQVRRLPVVNRDKRLVGVLSLGDLATESSTQREAEHALSGISEPSHPPMH